MLLLDPFSTIKAYRFKILSQIRAAFPFAKLPLPCDFVLFRRDGPPVHLLSSGSASIAYLLGAEAINLDWGERMHLVDATGNRLNPDFTVVGRPDALYAEVSKARQLVDKPTGLHVILLSVNGNLLVSFMQPGSFLFEALWEHGLSSDLRFTDVAGTFFGPDYRIWRSYVFVALSPSRFPTVCRPFRPAPLTGPLLVDDARAGGTQVGLDAEAMWAAMLDLQAAAPCVILRPDQAEALLTGHLSFALGASMDLAKPICLAFRAAGHWGFVFGLVEGSGLRWTYFDGLDFSLRDFARELVFSVSGLFLSAGVASA